MGTIYPTARYLIEVGYPMLNRMDYFLKDEPVIVEEKTFTDVITYTMLMKTADEEGFLQRLTNLSEGSLEPLRYEEIYYPWSE